MLFGIIEMNKYKSVHICNRLYARQAFCDEILRNCIRGFSSN